MSLASINKRIQQAEPNVELVRGDGYHYFVYDAPDEDIYKTKSEYVCYTSHLPDTEWIKLGTEFAWEVRLGEVE